MTDTKELLLTLPTFILAIFSLIGSIYVCVSAYMLRRLRQKSKRKRGVKNPFVITHCVFFMSLCDICINIWILLVWTPPIFDSINFYPLIICKIIGAFGQFFFVASVCWYSVILYIILILVTAVYSILVNGKLNKSIADSSQSTVPYHRMLDDGNTKNTNKSIQQRYFSSSASSYDSYDHTRNILTNKLNNTIRYGGIFTVLMATILTAIPFIGDSYGYVSNVSTEERDYFECWIIDKYYQMCLYVPILLYMIFAIILSTYSVLKVRKIAKVKSNKNFKKTKKGLLVRRLIAFTMIFVSTWIFPLIVRLWPIITSKENVPFVLLVLHHAFLGMIGLGNSIVWMTSSSFQSFSKSFKSIKGGSKYSYSGYNPPADKSGPVSLMKGATNRMKKFLTNTQDKKVDHDIYLLDDTTNFTDDIITNSGNNNDHESDNSSTNGGANIMLSYKLDKVGYKNLNRHKQSFKQTDNYKKRNQKRNKKRKSSGSKKNMNLISSLSSQSKPRKINQNQDKKDNTIEMATGQYTNKTDSDMLSHINSLSLTQSLNINLNRNNSNMNNYNNNDLDRKVSNMTNITDMDIFEDDDDVEFSLSHSQFSMSQTDDIFG